MPCRLPVDDRVTCGGMVTITPYYIARSSFARLGTTRGVCFPAYHFLRAFTDSDTVDLKLNTMGFICLYVL